MKREYIILLAISVVLMAPVGFVVADSLTHSASAGVTYETNSGVEVTLGDDRDIDAVPFADDQTFASGDLRLSGSDAAATVGDEAFAGDPVTLSEVDVDATGSLTVERTDLTRELTIEDGDAHMLQIRDYAVDDDSTDLSYDSNGGMTVTLTGLPEDVGIAAVDSDSGDVLDSVTDAPGGEAAFELPSGTRDVELQTTETPEGSETLTRPVDDESGEDDSRNGLKIETNTDIDQITVETSANTEGATTAYVTETDGTVIAESDISNGEATFDLYLFAGEEVYLTADAGGGGTVYTSGRTEDPPDYPIDGDLFSITSGVQGGDEFGLAWNINNINVRSADKNDPVIIDDSANPSDNETVSQTPVELAVDIEDADFETEQGDTVDVVFFDGEGNQIATDTLTENRTALVDFNDPQRGLNEWYVEATDEYGNTVTSDTFSFQTPSELKIYNEVEPDQLISENVSLRVRFFSGEDGEQIIEREADGGTVSLEGLPIDEEILVTVREENADFVFRRIVIDSIIDQAEIYLLPTSEPAAEVEFRVEDQTGRFSPSETRLYVEKAITQDGETEYRVISGDELTAGGGFPTILQDSERYRLRVENDAGEQRVLGSYVVQGAQTERIPIGDVQFAGDIEDGAAMQASLREAPDGADHNHEARIVYVDPSGETDELDISIEDSDGNELRPTTSETLSGDADIYVETFPLEDGFDPEEDTATVTVEATSGLETETFERTLGDIPDVFQDVPINPQLLELLALGSIVAVIGLLVIVSPPLAALVGPGYAGLLVLIGLAPIPMPAVVLAGVVGVLAVVGNNRVIR